MAWQWRGEFSECQALKCAQQVRTELDSDLGTCPIISFQCQPVAVNTIEFSISWSQRSSPLCSQRGQHGPFMSCPVKNRLNTRSGDWQVSEYLIGYSLINIGSFDQKYRHIAVPGQ